MASNNALTLRTTCLTTPEEEEHDDYDDATDGEEYTSDDDGDDDESCYSYYSIDRLSTIWEETEEDLLVMEQSLRRSRRAASSHTNSHTNNQTNNQTNNNSHNNSHTNSSNSHNNNNSSNDVRIMDGVDTGDQPPSRPVRFRGRSASPMNSVEVPVIAMQREEVVPEDASSSTEYTHSAKRFLSAYFQPNEAVGASTSTSTPTPTSTSTSTTTSRPALTTTTTTTTATALGLYHAMNKSGSLRTDSTKSMHSSDSGSRSDSDSDSDSDSNSADCGGGPDKEEGDEPITTSGNEDREASNRQNRTLVSARTGETITTNSGAQSDDEYTFVSCTTGDDLSLFSDVGEGEGIVGSGHRRRRSSGTSCTASTDADMEVSPCTSHSRRSLRRISLMSLEFDNMDELWGEEDGLLPIPEDSSSLDGADFDISRQPIDYQETKRRLDEEMARNLSHSEMHGTENGRRLNETSNNNNNSSSSNNGGSSSSSSSRGSSYSSRRGYGLSDYRKLALRRRLRVERYGGLRRRQSFERSKKLLQKNFEPIKAGYEEHIQQQHHPFLTEPQASLTADSSINSINSINSLNAEAAPPRPVQERIARFGGLTRRESFKTAKTHFEARFDKDVRPFVFPVRRRRSLSPASRKPSFQKNDFFLRMNKSESHLMIHSLQEPQALTDSSDSKRRKDKANDEHSSNNKDEELVLDPAFEKKHKIRQERFGGLRRRNSFKRTKRLFTKKFDKIQSGSKAAKERFGGLQRMKSYKQSRTLFQDPLQLLTTKSSPRRRSLHKAELAEDATAAQLSESSIRSRRSLSATSSSSHRTRSLDATLLQQQQQQQQRGEELSPTNSKANSTANTDTYTAAGEKKPVSPRRTKSESRWSYNLTRSRLRGQMRAGNELNRSFSEYDGATFTTDQPHAPLEAISAQ